MDNKRVKYTVDKNNKIVAAEIQDCEFDAIDLVNKKFVSPVTSGFSIACGPSVKPDPKFEMNYKYKAVAKLYPDDQWNEERGKFVACNKLSEVYHDGINRRLANYVTDLRKIADDIENYLINRNKS